MTAARKPMKIGTLAARSRQALADAEGPLHGSDAAWSSTALVHGSFGPWSRDASRLSLAGVTGFDRGAAFAAKVPNGVSSVPPTMDVLLRRGDDVLAVESKCTEYLADKRPEVSRAYLVLGHRHDERAASRWYAALEQVPEFRLLDAYQLIKHYLGLRQTFRGRPLTLVYLYWEPADAEAHPLLGEHRAEIRHFADLVGDDPSCRFAALSYAEHWDALEALEGAPAWLPAHLEALRARYDVTV